MTLPVGTSEPNAQYSSQAPPAEAWGRPNSAVSMATARPARSSGAIDDRTASIRARSSALSTSRRILHVLRVRWGRGYSTSEDGLA
jgi:hypothetical protein